MQVRHEGEHRMADVLAGGGITIASVAEREIEEAVWKADALLSAAGWASPRTSTRGQLRITPLNVPHGAQLGGHLGQVRTRPDGAEACWWTIWILHPQHRPRHHATWPRRARDARAWTTRPARRGGLRQGPVGSISKPRCAWPGAGTTRRSGVLDATG